MNARGIARWPAVALFGAGFVAALAITGCAERPVHAQMQRPFFDATPERVAAGQLGKVALCVGEQAACVRPPPVPVLVSPSFPPPIKSTRLGELKPEDRPEYVLCRLIKTPTGEGTQVTVTWECAEIYPAVKR